MMQLHSAFSVIIYGNMEGTQCQQILVLKKAISQKQYCFQEIRFVQNTLQKHSWRIRNSLMKYGECLVLLEHIKVWKYLLWVLEWVYHPSPSMFMN